MKILALLALPLSALLYRWLVKRAGRKRQPEPDPGGTAEAYYDTGRGEWVWIVSADDERAVASTICWVSTLNVEGTVLAE